MVKEGDFNQLQKVEVQVWKPEDAELKMSVQGTESPVRAYTFKI